MCRILNCMKKINKQILILIFLTLSSLVTIVVLMLINNPQNAEEKTSYLIPRENVPEQEWRRALELENNGEISIVKNIHDGYQIEMPRDWNYSNVADPIGGFTSYKLKEGETAEFFPGFNKSVLLIVQTVDNPKNLNVIDWLARSGEAKNYLLDRFTFEKVEHANEKEVYYSRNKLLELEVGETHEHSHINLIPHDPKDAFIDDSIKVNYIFGNKEHIYIASCGIMGTNHTKLLSECENIIQTFKILE